MNPYAKENIALRQQVSDLQYQLKQLRATDNSLVWRMRDRWGLTTTEARIVAIVFQSTGVVSKDVIHLRVYGHDVERGSNTIDVALSRARRKLAPDNITIQTFWFQGLFMPPESREIMRAAMALQ
jgi:DNA-binding response OmpR family regulator